MKTLTKRIALVTGLLCTALLCMGIVYIDTVNNYWQYAGGFIRLVVNTNAQASITVDTNTLRVGINTNNTLFSVHINGRKPAPTTTGNGLNASTTGTVRISAGDGGDAQTNSLAASGGSAGPVTLAGGVGGTALNTTSNSTGGAGGSVNLNAGAGGVGDPVSTNAITGGGGGQVGGTAGAGGASNGSPTNNVGGNGGPIAFSAGNGGVPGGGVFRKGGNGGSGTFTAGNGGGSTRTNGGDGGSFTFTAGNAGSGSTGDAGIPGNLNLVGGSGATGTGGGTNSNGGHIYFIGGAPASGASPGDVVLARNSAGTSRGGVLVGPATANAGALTNLLVSAVTTLDFPSVGAMTETNLTIAVTDAAPGDIPTLSFTNDLPGGTFDVRCSNGSVHVRFLNYSLIAIDPPSSTFRVKVEKFR